jgi:hypothetical protein
MEKTDRKLDSGENYASIYLLVEDKSDKQICCLIWDVKSELTLFT